MASLHQEFIQVTVPEGSCQALPVDEAKRVSDSEIQIQAAEEKDAFRIAEGFYASFPEARWNVKEPLHLRPALHEMRVERLAKRLLPSLTQPGMHWIKAVHVPSSTIVGVAGWAGPSLPVHNVLRRSAMGFYGWQAKMGWSDAEVEELWAHVDDEAWNGQFAADDAIRAQVVAEPHWYLTTVLTWPEWQGRGVGRKLLNWAIEQADAQEPATAMYLESSLMARPVYMHVGFVPQGESNFVRRGPR